MVSHAARALFVHRTGIDITAAALGAPADIDLSMLNVKTLTGEGAMALFAFNKALWDESRSFFAAHGTTLPCASAANRVADVAATLWEMESDKLQRGKAYGTKAKRSPEQTRAALLRSLAVIALLVKGGIFAYTDGSAYGSPGASGAGVCFAEGGVSLPDLSWALGTGTNNDAELFAIGVAVEAIWLARSLGLTPGRRAFVLSDSDVNLGRLARTGKEDDSPLLQEVRRAVTRCRQQGPLGLIWVPGHVGLEGNERADERAGAGSLLSGMLGNAEPRGGSRGFAFLTDDRVDALSAASRAAAELCSATLSAHQLVAEPAHAADGGYAPP